MSDAKRFPFVVIVLALLLTLTACGGLGGEPQIVATQRPSVNTQADTLNTTISADGAEIFALRCASCHGAQGKGDGEVIIQAGVPIPDFTDLSTITSKTIDEYYEVVTNGRLDKLMPPWKDALTEEQRWAVTQYVYDMGHNDGQASAAVDSTDTDAAAAAGSDTASTDSESASAADDTAQISMKAMNVVGQVTNGTANASLPSDIEVTLHAINVNFEDETIKTTANADGTFRFENLNIYDDRVYLATVNYGGVTFSGPMMAADFTKETLELTVNVYETTSEPAAIQMDSLTSQISIENNRLYVVQLVTLVNTGDKAYSGASIPLPEGAQPEIISEGRYSVSADGRAVVDNRPIVPNQLHTLHLAYSYPYTGELSISQPLAYDAPNGYEVIIASNGLELSGANMFALGGRETGMAFGTTVSQTVGSTLDFTVKGTPQAFTTDQSMPAAGVTTATVSPLAYVLIAAGVLFIGAAGVLFIRERQAKNHPADTESQVNALVKQIAALDLDLKQGKISAAAHEKRRSALKAQLLRLAQQGGIEQPQS